MSSQSQDTLTCNDELSTDDATFTIAYNSVNRDDVAVQFGWCSTSSYSECQKGNYCSSSTNLKQTCTKSISNVRRGLTFSFLLRSNARGHGSSID